ncbi:hypothetical protein [Mycolicibacterium lutetiense]
MGLADGAVVVVNPETTSTAKLFAEIARLLRRRGFSVNAQIEGWELRITTVNRKPVTDEHTGDGSET